MNIINHIIRETNKTHKVDGIAWTTALIKTSFPARERDLPDKLWILAQILSLQELKISFLDLPKTVGSLKYLACFSTKVMLRI